MFLWVPHCPRCAGHSGALGSATLTATLSASGHWKIESCEFVFVLVCDYSCNWLITIKLLS